MQVQLATRINAEVDLIKYLSYSSTAARPDVFVNIGEIAKGAEQLMKRSIEYFKISIISNIKFQIIMYSQDLW